MHDAKAAPYDVAAELPSATSVHESAVLVVAAFAVTLCRWTRVREVAIGVSGRVAQLHIGDQVLIEEFLSEVRMTRAVDHGPVDLVITSKYADLRRGDIRFTAELPEAAHGFVADAAAAVNELATLEGPLQDVRCIGSERRQILDGLVGADVSAVGVETLFLDQVHRRPRQIAVRDGCIEYTYEQLAHAADEYADVLCRAGVRAGDTVLVATRRSVGEVVALLAIIRCGAAYAGFDDDAPKDRAQRIIGKLAPAAVVVDSSTADHPSLCELTRVEAWRIEQYGLTHGRPLARPPASDPHRPIYIAFTSGSTGEPKGVVVPHRAVARLALSSELRMKPSDRVLRMAPLAFDASTFEIWVTLLTGATLVVFSAKLPSIGTLETFFAKQKVSVAWLTASLFRLIVQSRPKALTELRWILTGGEVVPHESAARMLQLHPGVMITNGYGPTENTTFTTTHTVRDSAEIDGPLAIGRPIAGTKVLILDENARPVPPGAIGELYVGGLGLADGYLDDEAGTKSRFGNFSPDVDERLYRTGDLVRLDRYGRLLYLGRADKQIKLNGHRIEIEEISAALARHPEVRDVMIIVTHQASRGLRIVAAVVMRADSIVDSRALRAYLSQTLPKYMVPTLWTVVRKIPLTRNGKVDEESLIESALPA